MLNEPNPKSPDFQEPLPQIPDPNGPPLSPQKTLVIGVTSTVLLVLGTGAALFLLAAIATPTSGARHSTRLQWQQQHSQPESPSLTDSPQLAQE